MNLLSRNPRSDAVPRRGLAVRWRSIALLALAAAAFPTRAPAGDPPQVELRVVIVTDSRCGAEGARLEDHRRCALERVSEGDRLVLFDPAREALYEIVYASEALKVKVLNDLAGFKIVARGRWDDEKRFVALTGAALARTLPPAAEIEPVD